VTPAPCLSFCSLSLLLHGWSVSCLLSSCVCCSFRLSLASCACVCATHGWSVRLSPRSGTDFGPGGPPLHCCSPDADGRPFTCQVRADGTPFALCRPASANGHCAPDNQWSCATSPPPAPPAPPATLPSGHVACASNYASCWRGALAPLGCCEDGGVGVRRQPFGCFRRVGRPFALCRPLPSTRCVSTTQWECPEAPPHAPPALPPPPSIPLLVDSHGEQSELLASSSAKQLHAMSSGNGQSVGERGGGRGSGGWLWAAALIITCACACVRYVLSPLRAGERLSVQSTRTAVEHDIHMLQSKTADVRGSLQSRMGELLHASPHDACPALRQRGARALAAAARGAGALVALLERVRTSGSHVSVEVAEHAASSTADTVAQSMATIEWEVADETSERSAPSPTNEELNDEPRPDEVATRARDEGVDATRRRLQDAIRQRTQMLPPEDPLADIADPPSGYGGTAHAYETEEVTEGNSRRSGVGKGQGGSRGRFALLGPRASNDEWNL
jgi:hypothetical protein